jgi:hypothetical protein
MSAPAWLFSFVDLAFLLLIAMTQLGSREEAPALGEIRVPELHAEADAELPPGASRRWQLRVHPRVAEGDLPFELVAGDGASEGRVGLEPLQQELARMSEARGPRPILAPHRESRSEDLLEAASALEALWPGRRRATMAPLLALR